MELAAIKELLDLGGLLAFAFVVWSSLKEQTKILNTLTKEMIKLSERQTVMTASQKDMTEAVQIITARAA